MIKGKIVLITIISLILTSCGSTVYVEKTTYPPQPAPVYNPPPPPQENAGPVNYQTFYDALAPYGTWVEDNEYGYVWVPEVGPDFQPYQSRGHWVYTDFGWTWVSDYQWGWATFHYGRWRFTGDYGWIWIPGYTWGPAWVAWRSSGTYYGWAPLGPPHPNHDDQYSRNTASAPISIGLSFSFNDAPEASHWSFVPAGQIASPEIRNYYVNKSQNTVIYQNTTIINNVTNVSTIENNRTTNNTTVNNFQGNNIQRGYIAGPSRSEVERVTGNSISPIPIANSNRPGQTSLSGNAITFYRPVIKAPETNASNTGNIPAPKQIAALNQVNPVYNRTQERGIGTQNAAAHISSTDNNPIEGAKLRFQNALSNPQNNNQGFNKPTINTNPNQINNPGFNRPNINPNNNPISNTPNPRSNSIITPINSNAEGTKPQNNAPAGENGIQGNSNSGNTPLGGNIPKSNIIAPAEIQNQGGNNLNGKPPLRNFNRDGNTPVATKTMPNGMIQNPAPIIPVQNAHSNPNNLIGKPLPNKPNPVKPKDNHPRMLIKPQNDERPKENKNLN